MSLIYVISKHCSINPSKSTSERGMAEKKKEINPINVNSSDSEDEKKGQEKEEELDLPLEKLNLGANKKLLVMNVNGLLVHRTSGKERVIKSRRADCKSGNYYGILHTETANWKHHILMYFLRTIFVFIAGVVQFSRGLSVQNL